MQASFACRHGMKALTTGTRLVPVKSLPAQYYKSLHVSRHKKPMKKMTKNSFLYQALIGVQEDLGDNFFMNAVKIVKHVLRFAVELCSMLSAVPYGLNTAALARSLPSFPRSGSRPSPPHLFEDQAPQIPTSGDAVAPAHEGKSVQGDDNQYRVVVDRGIHYGSGARETLDAYVPLRLVQQQRSERLQQKVGERENLAPVVLFTHGGVWASGETWHYTWMATRLAQMGFVVLVHTYTLFPDALIPQMVEETSRALSWTLDNVETLYKGDPSQVNVVGHSAGAHLVALSLLHRAEVAEKSAATPEQQHPQPQKPYFPSQHQVLQQQQQQQVLQQQQQQQQGMRPAHPRILIDDGRMPARFVGICGVYDIAAHYEYEKSRGVHLLSMMARAFSHKPFFDALSPSVLLEACMQEANKQTMGSQTGLEGQEHLRGHVSILASSKEGVLQDASAKEQQQQRRQGRQQQPEVVEKMQDNSTGPSPGSGAPSCRDWGSILQQAGLSGLSLTKHLPPCTFMGSQADFMVPYTSGKQMAECLKRCGVPTHQVHYEDIPHSQFVTVWPLLTAEQLEACSSQDQISVTASSLAMRLGGLPNYASDLVRILQGKY
ncbi:Alpha/Beta hydrolase protein [Dunaliella salina]|uniref:protein-S-isoprenylcysteine alpha-carbonyl methylesterase n=1 Tax=Dunaliella salina TaxID=3046 RepID=A0ABQ7H7Z7_DUNSA|nr:Alpha/Beta hydrolase protein [Dunaliella salina]|eukprot:KAF5842975.1 Alpha/Beta hydrolase protein [Dunaliella salina]